ncbi:MAG: hypothetical protein IPM50_02770 [Acidobacteriota bacterium]|nr:MAG: hypothetical protein IPM50_02770 [Acidobacteriota bacterium]
MARNTKRDAASYVNQNFCRIWQVMEALEGTAFEPVTRARIRQRTNLSPDAVKRAVITLKELGLAVETDGKISVGPRIAKFAQRLADSRAA